MTKFNKLSVVLIFIACLLIVFSFIAPYIFTGKFIFSNTGQIGDTIGGLMNPFIAIAGVIVTGLAFYMQYLANQIQVDNFNTSQKDQLKQSNRDLFIRLIDNLNMKVQNYTISLFQTGASVGGIIYAHQGTNSELKGYAAIDHIHRFILDRMKVDLTSLGYFYLAKYPENMDESVYLSIVSIEDDSLLNLTNRALDFKKKLLSFDTYDSRYNYLRSFLGNNYSHINSLDERLHTFAVLNFSKMDFDLRNSALYQNISMQIIDHYGSFINSYVQSLEYIIDYIIDNTIKKKLDKEKEEEEKFYRSYFLSNLTYHEKFILFYYAGSIKVPASFKKKLLDLNIFDNSFIKSKDMLIGDEDLMKKEIENVLLRTQSI